MWITEVQSYLLQEYKKFIQIQFEKKNEAIWKICSNERHLIPAKFVSLNLEASAAQWVGQEVRSLTPNCNFLLGEVWSPTIPWLPPLQPISDGPGTSNVLLMFTDGVLDIRWMKDLVYTFEMSSNTFIQIVSLRKNTHTSLWGNMGKIINVCIWAMDERKWRLIIRNPELSANFQVTLSYLSSGD